MLARLEALPVLRQWSFLAATVSADGDARLTLHRSTAAPAAVAALRGPGSTGIRGSAPTS